MPLFCWRQTLHPLPNGAAPVDRAVKTASTNVKTKARQRSQALTPLRENLFQLAVDGQLKILTTDFSHVTHNPLY
jgi:hypothetical protein